MPIQIACTSCAGRFRVPDNVAGKKIRCPKCKEVIQVPAASETSATTDAPASTPKPTPSPASAPKPTPSASQQPKATPTEQTPSSAAAAKPTKPAPENWFLKTEDGESYGPVSRAELDAWYAEGRVTADCQVLREGSDQWQWASEIYPELDPAAAATSVATTPDVAETPAEEPAATTPEPEAAPETPAPAKAAGDDPFSFLGGSGGAGGGEAFNFSSAPASSPTSSKASKGAAKTASASAPAAASASTADAGEVSSKSKLTAGLLAIFLGSLGVHRFYLGYTLIGVLQLVLCGGCGVWQVIDVVLIFMGKLPDAQGRPLKE